MPFPVAPYESCSFCLDLSGDRECAFGAIGANIYQNNGLKASQHEPHFHVHVVPKYDHSEREKLYLQRNYDVIPIEEQRQNA